MEIVHYKTTDSAKVATFFRKIFEELGWTERDSDYMDEPHVLFHLPDNGFLLIVKEEGKVIGTAGIIFLDKSRGLLKRFYLAKAYRGTGLAQKLLHTLFEQAKKQGIEKIILDVSIHNPRAIHFYEKSGFSPTTV